MAADDGDELQTGPERGHSGAWRSDPEVKRELIRAYITGYNHAADDARAAVSSGRPTLWRWRPAKYRRRHGVGSLETTTPKDR